MMPFSDEDWAQFMQLIGYSTSGYGDLSYADKAHVHKADQQAYKLLQPIPDKTPIRHKAKYGIVTGFNSITNTIEYVYHNGMKPRHGLAPLKEVKVIHPNKMKYFDAHVRRYSSLREYL